MPITKITPFTTIDYEGFTSAVLYFAGCNMRCVYCYNKEIFLSKTYLDMAQISSFLRSRAGLLDAVVFSGGECTLARDFIGMLSLCKDLGYRIKVDTNGTNTNALANALNLSFIDFVSLDFKASRDKFYLVTKNHGYENFTNTFKLLKDSGIKFEVRTTVHSELLNERDISDMSSELYALGYKGTYHIQNFQKVSDFGFSDNISNNPKEINPHLIKSKIKINFRNFVG
ncbi:anaerobic ribonucleoside-triphosphate reductase activating protein [Campylobacter sp. 19-13652]|uniref:anaerobic ribonucleoside-triphosphate reductase activating protein n=1 Tax=Campylobacter sp. 19-13652 TaxID=2840180 RepID=UPI001C7746E5|nr:anaerobic ribonucleoside-triphosphate reductase activating protein [Campylobacter sp. 19-13652]BCX78610.1 class III (anaerobic) ribonucleoside-triphosphate reductase activating protein NrdG [Campylobacter sp. 19-13652]